LGGRETDRNNGNTNDSIRDEHEMYEYWIVIYCTVYAVWRKVGHGAG
jgi:hypothetical protein